MTDGENKDRKTHANGLATPASKPDNATESELENSSTWLIKGTESSPRSNEVSERSLCLADKLSFIKAKQKELQSFFTNNRL